MLGSKEYARKPDSHAKKFACVGTRATLRITMETRYREVQRYALRGIYAAGTPT